MHRAARIGIGRDPFGRPSLARSEGGERGHGGKLDGIQMAHWRRCLKHEHELSAVRRGCPGRRSELARPPLVDPGHHVLEREIAQTEQIGTLHAQEHLMRGAIRGHQDEEHLMREAIR
jgi:hypothetical protein